MTFITMVLVELRNTITRKNLLSYVLFTVFFGIAVYSITLQPYTQTMATQDLLPVQMGEALILDILVAAIGMSLVAFESMSTGVPAMSMGALPALVITGPVFIALVMLARLAARASAATIAAERADKTLYILVGAQARMKVYLAKATASFLACTPMILISYAGIWWLDKNLMGLGHLPLYTFDASLSTVAVFVALGLLVSSTRPDAEAAIVLASRLTTLLIVISIVWLLLPLLGLISTVPRWLELLAWASPISLSMQSTYTATPTGVILQIIATIILFGAGLFHFNRVDVDY